MPRHPLPPPSKDLARAVLGIWRLTSREDHDRDGARHIDPILGADPLGILSFAPGCFAAQFMKRDRTGTDSPAMSPAGANNSGAVNGYDAYFGKYSLDVAAGTITVTLEGALSPANIGQSFVREIRADADELTIRLNTTTADGTPITRTLRFGRSG